MLLASLAAAAALGAASPELVLPDVIAAGGSEVRAAFTPDGRCVFWGSIPAGAPRGFEILYSCNGAGGWSSPKPAPFNTDANEFDPAVSPDGKWIYFFSNRPGGLGKDDIWRVPFDQAVLRFGAPENLGRFINTPGAEWAPVPLADGRLLFSSDGWGGAGKQDLFFGDLTPPGPAPDPNAPIEWEGSAASGPRNPVPILQGVNSEQDDFDAVYLPEARRLIFARGDAAGGRADLFVADLSGLGFIQRPAVRLSRQVNCSDELTIGPSLNPADPGWLYVSAYCPAAGKGRMDIFRVPLAAAGLPSPPAPSH